MIGTELATKLLGGTLIFSGALKIISPGQMVDLFPRLPDWFWFPAGLWEMAGPILVMADKPEFGVPLMYIFIGGIFCSIVWIPDNDGHSHVGGKGKLGPGGAGMLIPASFTTYLVTIIDTVHDGPLLPVLWACMGFAWGVAIVVTNKAKTS